MKRKKRRNVALWIIIILIFLLLVAISAILFMYPDYYKSKKVESVEAKTEQVEVKKETVVESQGVFSDENYTVTKSSVGGIKLGDKISDVKGKYAKDGNLTEISIGPDKYDKIYLFKNNGNPRLSIIADTEGRVNTIFAFDKNYVTPLGFKVGDKFASLLNSCKKKDMRFGDLSDGVNELGSAEMFNADGIVYIYYVEEDSENMLAEYNYENNSFKLKKNIPDVKICALMVGESLW